jgi:hypothetical protein
MKYDRSRRIRVGCLSMSMSVLIIPISFILTTIASTSVPTAYGFDHTSTAWDNQGYLKYVSTTISNESSSLGSENTTPLPDAVIQSA